MADAGTIRRTDAGTLTRADLADVIHREIGLSRAESAGIVERILHHMCHALSEGQNVKISGFGSFILRDKGERVGRNPEDRASKFRSPRAASSPSAPVRSCASGSPRAAEAAAMADATGKSEQAFRTIGELASELGRPAAYPALLGEPLPAAEAASARRQPPLLPARRRRPGPPDPPPAQPGRLHDPRGPAIARQRRRRRRSGARRSRPRPAPARPTSNRLSRSRSCARSAGPWPTRSKRIRAAPRSRRRSPGHRRCADRGGEGGGGDGIAGSDDRASALAPG